MSDKSVPGREQADARLKRAELAKAEGAKAMKEHQARARAIDANTARLKALRLAKEAAEQAAAVKKTKKAAPKKKKAG